MLGYLIDDSQSDREHLWFEVHGLSASHIDATLLNSPFKIARMRAGERADHSYELLSDWTIVTPFGQLTPRNLELARALRESKPKIMAALAKSERA